MKWSRFNLVFKTEKYGHLLYNSFSNSFAELTGETADEIRAVKNDPDQFIKEKRNPELIRELEKARVLVNEDTDEIAALKLTHYSSIFSNYHLSLTIAPTTDCNFRCSYCYESLGKQRMTNRIENDIVRFVKNNPAKSLSVTWYGGEPLLEFERIISMSNRFKKIKKQYSATIITNAYLLNDQVINQLNNLNIGRIQITLDGSEKVHNSRRPHYQNNDSFQIITANIDRLLASDWKGGIGLRVNTDKDNKDEFPKIYRIYREKIAGLKDKGMYINPGYVHEVKGTCADTISSCMSRTDIAEYEFRNFTENQIRDSGYYPQHFYTGCVANNINSFVIGPRGEIYKCWNDIGHDDRIVMGVNSDFPMNSQFLARYITGTDVFDVQKCRDCFYLPICMGGCPYNRFRVKYHNEEIDTCCKHKGNIQKYLEYHYEIKKNLSAD